MGAVWSVGVVVDAPVLDEDLGFEQVVEVPAVEQLVTEPAVEASIQAFCQVSRVDEDDADTVETAPVRDARAMNSGPLSNRRRPARRVDDETRRGWRRPCRRRSGDRRRSRGIRG